MIYTYNITDFKNNKIDIASFVKTVESNNLPIQHLVINDILCDIHMLLELTAEQIIILNNIVSQHEGIITVSINYDYVKIKEEEHSNITGGNFQSTVIDVDINHSGKTIVDKSFPFNISLFSAEWNVDTIHIGDIAEFHLAPDTVIGVITAPVAINDTVLHVNDTVINNIKLGFFVTIGTEELGMVLNVNKENSTITVQTPTTTTHNPMTYVKMTVKIVPKWRFCSTGFCSVGESKIGASYIPANTKLRLVYNNLNGIDNKLFGISIDYLY